MLAQELKRLAAAKAELLLLLPILAIAIFFRFYDLAATPPIMLGDEMRLGWEAMTVLEGEHGVFFPDFPGALPIQIYLEAVSFRLAGISVLTARAVPAATGVLTVAVLYFLVKRLFSSGTEKARLIAPLASLLLATSYWHVVHSRIAGEPSLVPFLVVSVSLIFWMAIESKRSLNFACAGVLLGISAYTYAPAFFLPLIFLSFMGYLALVDRGSLRLHLLNTVLLLSVALLVMLPLGYYALNHPDAFLARTRQVSVFNPVHNQGSPVRTFLISGAKTIGMFSFIGSPSRQFNPAGRPVLDPVASVILSVGIAVAVLRWRQPPYTFLVISLVVMCLPGALTTIKVPSYNRTLGAVPALCTLMSIGIAALWKRFKGWRASPWERSLFWAGTGIVLLCISALNFHDYFAVAWPPPREPNTAVVEAAEVMNRLDYGPEAVWILPAVPPVGREMLFTLESLSVGNAPRHYLDLDETEVARRLERDCRGYAKALVVDWKHYLLDEGHLSAFGDSKGRVPFLLTKYGQELDELEFENLSVRVYQLPVQPSFSIADDFEPANLRFGQELKLVAVAKGGSSQNPTSTPDEVNGPEVPSGKSGWVVLHWKAESVPSLDYKIAVCLVDQRRRRVAQADKALLSNDWQPTSLWTPGQEEIDYYTLPTMAGTPPGRYDIQIAVYNEETMERLPVADERGTTAAKTALVGSLQVVRPLQPAVVQPAESFGMAEGRLAPHIRLLGYDLPATTLHPGDTLSVALYWKALEAVHSDYVLTIHLRDQHGRVWAEERGRPVYGTYPTTEWAPGEVLRDWHDLSLNPETPSGSYELMLQVSEGGQVSSEISLRSVEVRGRAHLFEMPKMQHTLGLTFGEEVTLLGYDLNTDEIEAGDTLGLTLYWQAQTEMDTSYTVFTHLLDQEGQMWGQKDSMPGGGQLPTTSWVQGEILEDEYEIEVSDGAAAGEYVLEIGMYQWETGERLPVFDEDGTPQGDRILLDQVQILP